MYRGWLVLILVGCGRISFDPIGQPGVVDAVVVDAVVIDGITVSAPCDVPILIGQSTFASTLSAAVGATKYRVTWVDTSAATHVLGMDRTADTIMTKEIILPRDGAIPTPAGARVAMIDDNTYHMYWGSQSDLRMLGPDLGWTTTGTGLWQITDMVASGSSLFTLDTQMKLSVDVWNASVSFTGTLQIDSQQLLGPNLARAGGGSALVMTARPTLKDCTVWTYSSAATVIGTSVVPGDNVRCDSISGAYAAVDNVLAVAYAYQSATPPPVRVQALTASAQPTGTPTVAATGSDPFIGSRGSHFDVIYRPGAAQASYSLATLTSALTIQRDVPLHDAGTVIDKATIASGDSEALAVWVEGSDLWMRRLCGP